MSRIHRLFAAAAASLTLLAATPAMAAHADYYLTLDDLKDKLVIMTYKDRKWLLGVDKEFEFFLAQGKSFEAAYTMLKDKLDRRFVAAVAAGFAQLLQLGCHLFRILGSRRCRCENEQNQRESDDTRWPAKCSFGSHRPSSLSVACLQSRLLSL